MQVWDVVFIDFLMNVLGCPKLQSTKYWCGPQQNTPGAVPPTPFFTFLSVSLSSLPSSMSSLKVQSVLSFLTTELQRSCGRSALSITPFSGKNRSGLMVGGFPFNAYQNKTFLCAQLHQMQPHSFIVQCFAKHTIASLHITFMATSALLVIFLPNEYGCSKIQRKSWSCIMRKEMPDQRWFKCEGFLWEKIQNICGKCFQCNTTETISNSSIHLAAFCYMVCGHKCSMITGFVFTGWCLQSLLLRASWWWVQSFDIVEGHRLKPDRPALL